MVCADEKKGELNLIYLSIEELLPHFDNFRVGIVVAENLRVKPERSKDLNKYIIESEAKVADELVDIDVGELPEVKYWRKTYKEFGVKKTRYRSSVERLLKARQKGKKTPQIFNIVDVYNTISIIWRMPVGADDLDKVIQPQAFRYAQDGDNFIALGDKDQTIDSPTIGEVIYADAEKCLCRRWNWYQDARSAVSLNTNRAVLTVQAIEPVSAAKLEDALEDLCFQLSRFCQAQTKWSIADMDNPSISL